MDRSITFVLVFPSFQVSSLEKDLMASMIFESIKSRIYFG